MIARRGAGVLLVWLALLAAAAWQIARTNFVADLSAFLPADPDARQRVLIEQLQAGLPARTLLVGIDGGDAATRADASRRLAAAMRSSGLFEQVQNGQTSDWSAVGTWLFEHRYQLSPAVNAQRFTAAGLRDAITETVSLLGTPAGNAIKPIVNSDPTGETLRIAEALIPAGAPKSEQGVWVSRQGGRALLVATTKAAGADIDAHAKAIAAVRGEFAKLGDGLTLQLSGAPVMSVDSRARIEAETHWLAIVGTLAAGAILLAAFASLPALLVAMLPVASGVVAGIAAVSLAFGSVHGITLGFGTTLIGEAVDYALYYLIQARAAGWRAWVANGWPTVRLGLLTSVCGFAALVFSGFPGLRQLGVFSVAGLVAAALTARFVLPVLMPDGARGQGLRRRMGAFAAWAVARLPRLRWPLLALGVAAAAVLVQRPQLWSAELSSLSPVSKEALELDRSLRADLSAGDARTLVVVQGADVQATLRAAEAAGARLDALVEAGAITGYDSVTRWLPSLAAQRQRQAALPDAATLRTALADATRGGPLPASRLDAFIAAVEAARSAPPITPQALRTQADSRSLAPLVDALMLQRPDGSAAALLPLQGERIDAAAVQRALQEGGAAQLSRPEAQVIELGGELSRLYARYLQQAQWQAALGAVAVVLLMALTLRSPRRLAGVCLPLALAVLLTMAGLAAFGVQLGILHLVGLLLVVAVGSNYALFFDLLRQGSGAADSDTLASLLLANVVIVVSFGLIALSGIPALSAIGRVVAPGALLAMLLSAALLPTRSGSKSPAS